MALVMVAGEGDGEGSQTYRRVQCLGRRLWTSLGAAGRRRWRECLLEAQGGVIYSVRREENRPSRHLSEPELGSREAGKEAGRSREDRKREPRACEEGVEAADSGVGRAVRPGAGLGNQVPSPSAC